MRKLALIVFLGFGLLGLTENIFGQEFYKWADEKGTVHFSDNPGSSVFNAEKERPKAKGIEVLKSKERGRRPPETASGGKRIIIDYSQGPGGGSSTGGATTTIRSGRS